LGEERNRGPHYVNIGDVLDQIRNGGCNPGLAVSLREKLSDIYPYIDKIRDILLLAINNPGYSGQKFDVGIMQWINELDKRKNRNNFKICVDGGVNNETIKLLNVEKVVSGSFVLNAKDPIMQIMYLQTSGEYDEY
jgi:pentose-5-phosphate-3-epimerase